MSNPCGTGPHLKLERISSLVSYSWNQLKLGLLLKPARVLHHNKVYRRDEQVIPSGIWQNDEGCDLDLNIGM